MLHPANLASLAILVLGMTVGHDWPQWRGPALDGTLGDADRLPTAWSSSTNIDWRVPLPAASTSSPVVAGGLVFVQTATTTNDIELWAVARRTGTVSWRRTVAATANRRNGKHDMTAPSPVTDGRMVWVMTGTGIVAAFAHDGTERWRRNLQLEYGAFGQQFGFASSPLLVGNALYIPVIHGMHTDQPSYLLRLDAATGRSVWRVERRSDAVRESRDAYSTPTLVRRADGSAVVVAGADVVTGHDPATGRELWRVGGLNPENRTYHQVVASPFVSGDRLVVPTRVKPLGVFRLGTSITRSPSPSWTFDRGADVPTPVSDGKLLYVISDRGVLHALDMRTGKTTYGPERLAVGTYTSSPVVAGGRLFATNEDGTTTVVRTGPNFEVLAENRLNDQCLSSLAPSAGQIFIRTAGFLWAVGAR